MREKLIELLEKNEYIIRAWGCEYGEAADHLIANDVITVVRCKDCKHKRHNRKYDVILCDHDIGMRGLLKPTDFCPYGVKER